MDDLYINRKQLDICNECIFSKSYKIVRPRIIKNSGNKKLLIISDYPGYYESETGVAYSGRTGKFILKLFSNIDFSIIVMNAVNHYNPNIPEDSEIEACSPFLRTRLLYYLPNIIWIAGRLPFKSFNIDVKGEYIYNSILKGVITYSKHRFPFIGTVNPALVLRMDSSVLYNIVTEAVKMIKNDLEGEKDENI